MIVHLGGTPAAFIYPHAKSRRAIIAATVVGTSTIERSSVGTGATGPDAPHQERNPFQHPELWTR